MKCIQYSAMLRSWICHNENPETYDSIQWPIKAIHCSHPLFMKYSLVSLGFTCCILMPLPNRWKGSFSNITRRLYSMLANNSLVNSSYVVRLIMKMTSGREDLYQCVYIYTPQRLVCDILIPYNTFLFVIDSICTSLWDISFRISDQDYDP